MRRVFVVRHGNTFGPGELPRRVGGRTDFPLVESGRAQAVALGRYFCEVGIVFDQCWAGPLARTQDTARSILAAMAADCPFRTLEWLREIDHGPDEGQSEAAVLARIGPAALDAWERKAEPPPGWVVDVDARRTAWDAFLADQARAPAGAALVVTSNGVARFALADRPAKLRTGAWGVIAVGGGLPRLVEWDRRPD